MLYETFIERWTRYNGLDYISPMDRMKVLQDQRIEILRIAQGHGVLNIRVFGSTASGKTSPSSDVDFLVVMRSDSSLFDQVGLVQDLHDLLGLQVHVVTEKALHWYIRDRVMADAVEL